jgi:DNA-binding transcriptional MocR family regulator
MHMVLDVGGGAGEIAATAREQGVAVGILERYFTGPVTANALVLGYGGSSLADVTRACQTLAGILRARQRAGLRKAG